MGSSPRLYDDDEDHRLWYSSYTLTYIERDVRQIIHIQDLKLFKRFLKMCAGRVGQLLNIAELAHTCGITEATTQSWLSVLEASYIIFFLSPHYKNFGKRLVKTQKLYFYDTGLASYLLDIETPRAVDTHFARGALVENLIISDLMKQRYNAARIPSLYFWRDNHGYEIDYIIEKGEQLYPVEIKAGRTINPDYFKNIIFWNELTKNQPQNAFVVYAGKDNEQRKYARVVSWDSTDSILKQVYTEQ